MMRAMSAGANAMTQDEMIAALSAYPSHIENMVSTIVARVREKLAGPRRPHDPDRGRVLDQPEDGLPQVIAAALNAGGVATANVLTKAGIGVDDQVRGAKVKAEFNKINPKALSFAERRAGALIVQVTAEVRSGVREIVTRAHLEGIAPREAARLIKQTVGLLNTHADAVMNYRQAILDSPGKTVSAGSGMTATQVKVPEGGLSGSALDEAVQEYADGLLTWRSETIARTETIEAANQGQRQMWDQAIEDELLPPDIEKVWIASPDACPFCEALDGQQVPVNESFQSEEYGELDGPTAHPNCTCSTGLARAS